MISFRIVNPWHYALVAILALVAMLPTIAHIAAFDDADLLLRTPQLYDFSNFWQYFTTNIFADLSRDYLYRPIYMLSLFIDAALYKDAFLGYHLNNVLLHVGATCLFLALLRRLHFRHTLALFSAALFAVHPIHVDVVAFVTNRSDLLASIFLLLSCLSLSLSTYWCRLFIDNPIEPSSTLTNAATLTFASILFFLALLCKESAAVLIPITWGIYLLSQFRRQHPSNHRGFIILAATQLIVFAIYVAIRIAALGAFAGTTEQAAFTDRSLTTLVPTICRILATYVRFMILPWSQQVDYTNFSASQSLFESSAIAAYIQLGLFIIFLVLLRSKKLIACAIGFFAALLPVLHLIPIRETIAERFLYIPSFFGCTALALVMQTILTKTKLPQPKTLSTAVVLVYFSLCFTYAQNFTTEQKLWSTMVERDANNPKFHYNYAVALYQQQGRCQSGRAPRTSHQVRTTLKQSAASARQMQNQTQRF